MQSGLRKGRGKVWKGTGIPGSLSPCGLLYLHTLQPGLFCFSVQGQGEDATLQKRPVRSAPGENEPS